MPMQLPISCANSDRIEKSFNLLRFYAYTLRLCVNRTAFFFVRRTYMQLEFKTYGTHAAGSVPLLILHGLFGEGENWASWGRLWGGDRMVVIPDLPLHGQMGQNLALSEFNYTASAQLLADHIQHGKFIPGYNGLFLVMGHSMGGKLAMSLALLHPACVSRLCVVDIAPKSYAPAHTEIFAAIDAINRLIVQAGIKSRSDADQAIAPIVEMPAVRAFLLKSLLPPGDVDKAWHWKFNVAGIRASYDHIAGWITLPPNTSCSVEAHFIGGELSPYILPEDSQIIQHLFPGAVFHTVANAGHWVQADNREGFLQACGKFFQNGR